MLAESGLSVMMVVLVGIEPLWLETKRSVLIVVVLEAALSKMPSTRASGSLSTTELSFSTAV